MLDVQMANAARGFYLIAMLNFKTHFARCNKVAAAIDTNNGAILWPAKRRTEPDNDKRQTVAPLSILQHLNVSIMTLLDNYRIKTTIDDNQWITLHSKWTETAANDWVIKRTITYSISLAIIPAHNSSKEIRTFRFQSGFRPEILPDLDLWFSTKRRFRNLQTFGDWFEVHFLSNHRQCLWWEFWFYTQHMHKTWTAWFSYFEKKCKFNLSPTDYCVQCSLVRRDERANKKHIPSNKRTCDTRIYKRLPFDKLRKRTNQRATIFVSFCWIHKHILPSTSAFAYTFPCPIHHHIRLKFLMIQCFGT